MLEPPSTSLLKTLSALKLCSPRDLRRCRGYVRRQTRDLPAFDSIWIDALVQTRRLTAFQGRCLEAGDGDLLQVGPCLLLERLGGSPTAETFLASRRGSSDLCVLKLTASLPQEVKPQSDQLSKLVALAQDFEHPAIVLPQANQIVEWPSAGDSRLVTISRYARGPHLAELLTRRGRFPAAIAVEIARQLIDGLAALESHGLAHGDVSLRNVRISSHGQAVLVDAGLITVFRPEFSFHNIRSAEKCDGLAPERISAGLPPTSSSDIYALGCLIWHLLAGRPPFAIGDPLAKLAVHQTQVVPDIREWVPEAPSWLAEMLLRWTATNPLERPHSFREAAADLGKPSWRGRRNLAHFRGEFDRSMPVRPVAEAPSRWPITVAAIFAMSGAALSLFDQGARNFVLSLARPHLFSQNESTVRDEPSSRSLEGQSFVSDPHRSISRELQSLPPPDSAGRVILAPGGRYFAEELSARGTLQIIGDRLNPAEVVVGDSALFVWAERISLSNVKVVRQSSAANPTSPLLIAECQRLEVVDSRFDQENIEEPTGRRPAAIAWRPQESRSRQETRVLMTNVVFTGYRPALFLDDLPADVSIDNVLKIGRGDFIQLRDSGHSEWSCHLHRVTLRQGGPLLRVWPLQEHAALSHVKLSATSCVFDLQRPSDPSLRPALIAWMTGQLPVHWRSSIEWQLTGALVPPDVDVISRIDPKTGQREPVDESQLDLNGLVAAKFEFAGPLSPVASDSSLTSSDAPLAGNTVLGIDAEALPQDKNYPQP